ncbi:tRNA (adenosine(37)-N6)-threonylcarbamoyltransferase complex dimerization subunit type 1 TsaB [Candidatus Protochlamydia phocaeensis]|uniref:tRNA (adenosine(37)-N6)-threonylcarbamoyltransferase complex dimerization subunit type 1 TsaB n=1 Tax=Candidatus Protochlamydia phocaeensis TaxID=1414722 RepID=UPI00083924DC|nr:tRNA (adenosine(37)-N6)-threonylcarbamoyltransferase complex dimerization subunit type 1 TsaB [Candidatus Protochlamydia phocaeensis]
MYILLIETSTERGVIACLNQLEVVFAQELPFGSAQSKFLMPELAAAMEDLDVSPTELTCIGVGIGPGSYTGIRMGVSVAQALSFSWNLPLIGVCSLDGFVPTENNIAFAAIIDAKIGGAYVRKGYRSDEGVRYLSEPILSPLEDIKNILTDEVSHLVSPSYQTLKAKLDALYPNNPWQWEERPPSVEALAFSVEAAYQRGLWKEPGQPIDLLYLRETEAEREKKRQADKS